MPMNTSLVNLLVAQVKKLGSFIGLEGRCKDVIEGVSLAKEFDDEDLAKEAIAGAAKLEKDIREFELLTLLNRPNDEGEFRGGHSDCTN